MAEALALLALLEDHGDADDEQGIDTDEAKDGGEDVVEEDVGKGRHGAEAATLQSGGGGRGANVVSDKGGRGAVEVTAALELSGNQHTILPGVTSSTYRRLHQALNLRRGADPDVEEEILRAQGEDPEEDADY